MKFLLRFKLFRRFVNRGIEPYGLRLCEPGEGIYDGMTDDELDAFRAQRRARAADNKTPPPNDRGEGRKKNDGVKTKPKESSRKQIGAFLVLWLRPSVSDKLAKMPGLRQEKRNQEE